MRREVEYRRTPTDPDDDLAVQWRPAQFTTDEADGSDVITGLIPGDYYDVRTRAVDETTGAFSDWTVYEGVLIERPDGTPPAPRSVRFTKGDCITWEPTMEVLDLRGYRVRHAAGTCDDEWLRAEPAHEGLVSHAPFILCRVPKGRRTLLVCAEDWDGNLSEPVRVIADRGPVDDVGEFTVRTVDEAALGFPDSRLAGGTVTGSTLTADSAAAPGLAPSIEPAISIDPNTPAIPEDPDAPAFWPVWGGAAVGIPFDGSHAFDGLYRWIEYVWQFEVHSGEDGPRAVLSVDVGVSSVAYGHEVPWRLEYRLRSASVAIPADGFSIAIPADGAAEGIPDQQSRPWHPWPGRLNPLSAGIYEFRLVVPGGHLQARVTALAVTVSSDARVVHVQGLSVPALGGTRVPLGDVWRELIEVRVVPVGATVDTSVPVDHKSQTSGPSIRTFQSGVEVAGIVDATIRGY